jgi:hypothetical protein
LSRTAHPFDAAENAGELPLLLYVGDRAAVFHDLRLTCSPINTG